MGSVYRRQVRFCVTCRSRLTKTAQRQACEAAGHDVEVRALPIWWIKYVAAGRPQCVSSGSEKKEDANLLLKLREGEVARGVPLTAKVGSVKFEEAALDLENDYTVNGKRSLVDIKRRVDKHLNPVFGGRRLSTITTSDIRSFCKRRQNAGASNAEINRELTALKRMFTLAIQAGKLVSKPFIPMLREGNVRQGFFEREQFESVRAHLPASMRPVAAFAYVTGWRVPSEVLTLEWRQVDLRAGEVRLDAGTTKNGEGASSPSRRTFGRSWRSSVSTPTG